MNKPSDYFKKLDLAHLDANTAQFIREKVLTLPNIDILEGTKEFETIKAIVEENFPRAIGIEPVVIEPIIEVVPEPIIEAVVEPIIDTKQEEIKTISGQVSEMTDLIDLLSELVAENPSDLDSLDVLELYKENLVELADKLKSLTEVITEAVIEVKDNIEEVKEVIKTDVVDIKGILTAPKQYKTEDGENVLGYESNWNIGTKKHLGETVVYYVSNEDDKNKYSVLSGILHKGEIVYSEDKTSNKEFEKYSENVDDALKLAFELANDKDMVDKFENGGEIGDKFYYEQHGIGKAKYTVSYHDGVQKHKDGSPFYGIKTFKNKKDLNEFISKLNKEGYKYKNDSYTTKYVAIHESKDGYWTIASKPSSKEDAEAMLGGTPKNEVGKVVTLEEARAHKKTVGEEYLYAKGGIIVTSISDIPNIKEKVDAGAVTYRGLGMGKKSDDFYKIAKENGVLIKLDGEEYYITDTDFRKLNWDFENEKWLNKIKFLAPFRKFENGGSIGFIPMELENDLAIISSRVGLKSVKDVIGILNAMIDSGLTDEDLKIPPTKTGFQYQKALDKKTREILDKIEGNIGESYKDGLKGNMPYSAIRLMVENKSNGKNLLKEFKPWRESQKFENGGEIKNIDKIKKSIGDTIFNHISSLNEEQLEKQLKQLKVELNREYSDSNGKSERYKKLNDEMYYILYRLERAADDFTFKVGEKVQIIDEPKSSQKPYEVIGHENYNEKYGWETIIKNGDEKLTMFENMLEAYKSDSDKDENIAKIRFNDHWKTVQLFIDGSLYGEFDTYQEAVKEAENNNSKVILVDDVTMLNISSENPLSRQLSAITGDGWNAIDYENLDGGKSVTTAKPFKHVESGKIFEVYKK